MAPVAGASNVHEAKGANRRPCLAFGRQRSGSQRKGPTTSSQGSVVCASWNAGERGTWDAEGPGGDQEPAEEAGAALGLGLLAAVGVERLGEQAWLFATPFLLMALQSSGNSLAGPALYGISRMIAQAIFAPSLGSWMDRMPRMPVLKAGIAVQVTSMLAATVLCCVLSTQHSTAAEAWPFLLICALGVADAMGKILTGVAIIRDWVPALYGSNERRLSSVNGNLARLDLFAEVLGPIGAGLVFQALGNAVNPALAALAITRAACLVVQLQFFVGVLESNPDLEQRSSTVRTDQEGEEEEEAPGSSSSGVGLLGAWRTFLGHGRRVQLVVLSYALLYLTVLSPHGLVLTAYLSTCSSLSPVFLSLFRSCGALVGVVGVTAFEALTRRLDGEVQESAQVFVLFQAACSVAAAAAFVFATSGSTGTGASAALYVFMALVVLARFGLYGFEIGALQLQQSIVFEDARGAFGTVEKSLCAAASLIMYAASGAVTDKGGSLFTYIVCTSAVAICASAAVFRAWLAGTNRDQFLAA